MTTDGLRLERLVVRYGKALAVNEVSIEAAAGAVTAIVGPNGAGKSSIVHSIYGSTPSSGGILFGADDISRLRPLERARAGIAIVPQGRQIFPKMSVRENLRLYAELLRLDSLSADAALDRYPILRTRANQPAGVLSGGEQQMLVVTRALMANPKVVLLDEMATGLAPKVVDELCDTVAALAGSGVAILMAAPSLGASQRIVDRGYVLVRGSVAASATGGGSLDAAYMDVMGVLHEEIQQEATAPD